MKKDIERGTYRVAEGAAVPSETDNRHVQRVTLLKTKMKQHRAPIN